MMKLMVKMPIRKSETFMSLRTGKSAGERFSRNNTGTLLMVASRCFWSCFEKKAIAIFTVDSMFAFRLLTNIIILCKELYLKNCYFDNININRINGVRSL